MCTPKGTLDDDDVDDEMNVYILLREMMTLIWMFVTTVDQNTVYCNTLLCIKCRSHKSLRSLGFRRNDCYIVLG